MFLREINIYESEVVKENNMIYGKSSASYLFTGVLHGLISQKSFVLSKPLIRIQKLQIDPQDRGKVYGVPGGCSGFKVQGLCVCMV